MQFERQRLGVGNQSNSTTSSKTRAGQVVATTEECNSCGEESAISVRNEIGDGGDDAWVWHSRSKLVLSLEMDAIADV